MAGTDGEASRVAPTRSGARTGWSLVVLVAANLVPLAGVVFWDWHVATVVVLFWLENGIIGLATFAKILTVARKPADYALAPFFALHYGLFFVVHGVFVALIFAFGVLLDAGADRPALGTIAAALPLPLLGLAASHAFSLYWNFWRGGERHRLHADHVMMMPYSRVVALHVTIIAAAFLVLQFESPLAPLILLIVVKTVIDAVAHRREHAKASEAAASEDEPWPVVDTG